MNPREAIETAARLEQMGVVVRSAELQEEAAALRDFHERGGNRAMRRARARASRRHGKGYTRR